MPLILPSPSPVNSRHPISLPVGQFYSYREITGNAVTLSDLTYELHPIPQSEAIRWLCSLSKGILSAEGMKPKTQIQWARQLFPPEWSEKLEAVMRAHGADAGSVFHKRAVWLVLQLAVISCRSNESDMAKDDLAMRLGRACFMANDLLTDIEAEWQQSLPHDDPIEWMIATLVPLHDSATSRVDFDLLGRSVIFWEEAARTAKFQSELSACNAPSLESAFTDAYGISLSEFLRFIVGVYVRFVGKQLEPELNPLLLEIANDEIAGVFDDAFRARALGLISQNLEELSIRFLQSRQSWAFDVTPIRERPLIEVMPGKFCCPDLTIFVRSMIDRVYFLLQEAYGKKVFRSLVGKLFECYIDRLIAEFAVTSGRGRTYLPSPRFQGTTDEAADGILLWTNTAVVMEFKAGLLSTRQRLAGVPSEVFQGIDSLLARGSSGNGRKGIVQLARNIARMLIKKSKVVSEGDVFDLSGCNKIYPVLVCFDEALGIHAVQKWLQPKFEAELTKAGVAPALVGPLMVVTIRDVEALATAGQSLSVEQILHDYARHLVSQPRDFTGSFSTVIRHSFGQMIKWEGSATFRKHQEMLQELMARFKDADERDE